jgi:hypothetical protein
MRRCLSIFVLVLLLAPLALPLTLAGGAPALPICCRPGGAHHCTGGMTGQAPQGDGFRDAARACPYAHATLLPNSLRPQAPAAVIAPQAAEALQAVLVSTSAVAPLTGLRSTRAPPALSSL